MIAQIVYEAFVLQAEEPDKSLASNINGRSSNRLSLKDLGIQYHDDGDAGM